MISTQEDLLIVLVILLLLNDMPVCVKLCYRAIFACLEHLAESKKFYNDSHVLFVVECLIRAVHFLTKQSNSFQTLKRALVLLAGLFKG
jgi:hypothetical protein